VREIAKRVRELNPKNAVVFATGDDILFRGYFDINFLHDLQNLYASETGSTCSIGYGKSFREVYVALKMAKSTRGKNAIVGIELV
jgi:minimal CRISPR polymerase domain